MRTFCVTRAVFAVMALAVGSGCTKAASPKDVGTLGPVPKSTVEQKVSEITDVKPTVTPVPSAPTPTAVPAPPASGVDNSSYFDVGNALSCDSTSGRPPFQAQDLFELEYFEKATAFTLDSSATTDQYVAEALKRLAMAAPLRAARIAKAVANIKSGWKPTGLGIPQDIGPSWLPSGCKLAYLILKSGDGFYAVNTPVWKNLAPIDQAAALIHAGALSEAETAGAKTANLTDRQFVRLLFKDVAPTRDVMTNVVSKLGPSPDLERAYKNGDVALYRTRDVSRFEDRPFDSMHACGYVLANGKQDNRCTEEAQFEVYSAGEDRILRMIGKDQKTIYLVDPTEVGLPAGTVDYIFGSWRTSLPDPDNKSEWVGGNMIQFQPGQDVDLARNGMKFRCAANHLVSLFTSAAESTSYRVNLASDLLHLCQVSAPTQVTIGEQTLNVPSQVVTSEYVNYPKSLIVQVAGATAPIPFTAGKFSFTLQNDDRILGDASSAYRIDFAEGHKLKLVAPTLSNCVLSNSSLSVDGDTQTVSGSVQSCVIKGPHSRVTVSAADADVDAGTGTFLNVSGSDDLSSSARVIVELNGAKFNAEYVYFSDNGDIRAVATEVIGANDSIPYYDVEEGKKEVSHPDSGGDWNTFCFNSAQNRLERYSAATCPSKNQPKGILWQ